MNFKKLFVLCCVVVPLTTMACQKGGNYGHYDRKLSKKDLRIGPNIARVHRLVAWELLQQKKGQKLTGTTHQGCLTLSYPTQNLVLPDVGLTSTQESPRTPRSYRSCHPRSMMLTTLLLLLLYSPYSCLAQQQPSSKGPSLAMLCEASILPSSYCPERQPLNGLLNGKLQPIVDSLDSFAQSFDKWSQENPTVAKAAVPSMMIGLKTLYGTVEGAVTTKTWQGAGIGGIVGAGIGTFDEIKSGITEEVLGDVIDSAVHYGAQKIAPILMKYDSELSEESAVRLASFIGAATLQSHEFKNFLKHFPKYDFSSVGLRKDLVKLSRTQVDLSDFAPGIGKIMAESTPGIVSNNLEKQAFSGQINENFLRKCPNTKFEFDGTIYQPFSDHWDQFMKTGKLPEYVGTPYEQYIRNSDKIFHSENLEKTLQEIGRSSYKSIFDQSLYNEPLHQSFMGASYSGVNHENFLSSYQHKFEFKRPVYQPFIEHWDQFVKTGKLPDYVGTPYEKYIRNSDNIFHSDNLQKTLTNFGNVPYRQIWDSHYQDLLSKPSYTGSLYGNYMQEKYGQEWSYSFGSDNRKKTY